ncbi:hypothetical protein [Gordonia sp. NPDC003376]
MTNSTKVLALLLSGIGAVAVIVALVLSFIPWSASGAAEATPAFRAQSSLDQVAFQYGSSPGARYNGTLVQKYGSTSETYQLADLTVTLSNNASGQVTVDGQRADYTQIGNYAFAKAPTAFWQKLLSADTLQDVDLAPFDNAWAGAEWAMPSLGSILSPQIMAGRIGNADLVSPPTLGAELASPNANSPDARFWPTSDPPIETLADDKVRAGKWEITFDPSTKAITHLKGEYATPSGRTTYQLDTDVTPLPVDQLNSMFDEQRGLTSQLASVPAPGMLLEDLPNARLGILDWKQTGDCTNVACGYDFTVSGTPKSNDDAVPGHVNYGLTINFIVNSQPAGALGGTCTPVVRVDFGRTGSTRCVATNLGSGGGSLRPNVKLTYLPFLDYGAADLTDYLKSNQEATQRQFTMQRTGTKRPDAANYNFYIAGLPSSYVIKRGDYLFDGYGPRGAYLVAFAPGYADHVTGTAFDPSWAGTTTLRDQMTKQVAAAGDGRIVYYSPEQKTVDALKAMVTQAGLGDHITVYLAEQES